MDIVLGTYNFDRETKNTVRYQMLSESGRPDTIYVQKSKFEGTVFPPSVEVVIRTP